MNPNFQLIDIATIALIVLAALFIVPTMLFGSAIIMRTLAIIAIILLAIFLFGIIGIIIR